MNTSTQGTIGKIFLQSALVLVAFAGLTTFAQAHSEEQVNLDALFETAASTDVKRYLASQDEQFTATELKLAEIITSPNFELNTDGKHLYAKAGDSQSWPLLSMQVQNGDLNMKMGSKYVR